jgi:hypothetical protein
MDADELVATCTAEQGAVVAREAGSVAVVDGRRGTITYDDWVSFSGGPDRRVKVDFRRPSDTACSPECQRVVSQLGFGPPV